MSGSTTPVGTEVDVPILVVVADFAGHFRGEVLADAADIATLLLSEYAQFVVPARIHQGDPLLIDAADALTDEAGRAITR